MFSEFNLFETLEEVLKNQQPQQTLSSTLLPNKSKKINKTGKDVNEWDIDYKILLNMCIEILIMCLVNYPIYLKKYCTSERQKILKYPFLNLIIDNINSVPEISTQNLVSLIRFLK